MKFWCLKPKKHNHLLERISVFTTPLAMQRSHVVKYTLPTFLFIPHATSCRGYNVFDPSVSQSVSQSASPVFLVSTTPLKPLNKISWNFVVMKDIMCRYAFLQEMLIWSFWGAIHIPFLSDCPSLMLGIAIHCIQHSQTMLERGVCELAHSFFHCARNP